MMGMLAINRKSDEKMMIGMTEMKPSRMALRYLLRATASKKGFPLSMSAIRRSMTILSYDSGVHGADLRRTSAPEPCYLVR